jgi:exosome complex component RRP40
MSCRLLDTGHFLIKLLFSYFPDMEVVVGTNGRVWINADEPKKVIAIARCIEMADPRDVGMDKDQIQNLLQEIMA